MRLAEPPLLALPAGAFRKISPSNIHQPWSKPWRRKNMWNTTIQRKAQLLLHRRCPCHLDGISTGLASAQHASSEYFYGKIRQNMVWNPIATKQHCNTKIPCELIICDYTVIDYISIMICSGFADKAHAINFLLIGFLFLSCYMLLWKCCLHTARLMTSV